MVGVQSLRSLRAAASAEGVIAKERIVIEEAVERIVIKEAVFCLSS
jgi:hypothetical protein